jgi:alpha-D-ribose 1-methylphosphonate 5-triphosphate diphosphatase PhnM
MQGLTAKVFRTYNASYTMSELLKDMNATGTNAEKVKAYNDANRKVAILCNHKRTVTASHANQMEKMSERVRQHSLKILVMPEALIFAYRSRANGIRNGALNR